MQDQANTLRTPAETGQKTLKSLISKTLERFFGCRHENPAFPIWGVQECPDCGALRDYAFAPAWYHEHAQLLHDHTKGYITADQFAAAFHRRLVVAQAVRIGEWRKGGL